MHADDLIESICCCTLLLQDGQARDRFGPNSAQEPLVALFTLAGTHLDEAERVRQCGRCCTLLLFTERLVPRPEWGVRRGPRAWMWRPWFW